MNSKMLMLVFILMAMLACKKKIPHDAVVNKMAGRHDWWGIEMNLPPRSAIWDVDSLKFAAVIYAVDENTIMYYDSALSRMIPLYYFHHNTSDQSVSFEESNSSSYNVIQYYYLKDSFFWERHRISGPRWILHSP